MYHNIGLIISPLTRSSRVKRLEDATTLLTIVTGIDAWTGTRGGNSRSLSTLVRELGPHFPVISSQCIIDEIV